MHAAKIKISMSVIIQNQVRIHMYVLSHNYHCYYVLEYLHFLMNHPVHYCRKLSRDDKESRRTHTGFTRQYKHFLRKPLSHRSIWTALSPCSFRPRKIVVMVSIRHSRPAVSLLCSQNALEIITFTTVLIKTDSNVLVFLN